MFQQIIAIIKGVEVPWKLLTQGLYYGCAWITIRPVWLVVERCSQVCTRLATPHIQLDYYLLKNTKAIPYYHRA
jgi:hypothetical protein